MTRSKRTRRRQSASYEGLSPATVTATKAAKGSSKKTDTRCEVALRMALDALGLHPERCDPELPGKPDLVFRNERVLVFCDGDFWHGRRLKERLAKLSEGHNATYWVAKIKGNVARDRRRTRSLRELGWTVLRFWETDIHADPASIARRIATVVRHSSANYPASSRPSTSAS